MLVEAAKADAQNLEQVRLVNLDSLVAGSSKTGFGLLDREEREVVRASNILRQKELQPLGRNSFTDSQHASKGEGKNTRNPGPAPR